MREEHNDRKIVIVRKRSKSKVYICMGAEPLYLMGLLLGREETLTAVLKHGGP